jgi:Porin subfamily
MRQASCIKAGCVIFGVIMSAQAVSQTLVEPLPGAARPPASQPGRTATSARPCPEYGAGFVRIDGSRSCIKLSGAVAAEYGVRSGRGGLSTGSAAGAVVQSETRTDTGYGELRTVVRGRGQVNRGLETAPYR